MDKKKLILDFIKKHKICVISTVSAENKPQSAVLEFGETESLEIIFDTFENARKCQNLGQNKNVSVVIGWDEDITVQYEGVAQEIVKDDIEKYTKPYFEKNPEAAKWKNQPGICFFKVTPKWIRYSDLNKNPWEVIEINF